MEHLILQFDFIYGPVWKKYFDMKTHKHATGIDVVDQDKRVWELNDILSELYCACYEFDVDDQPCVFKKENADPEVMLDYLRQLKERLNEVNDGSFVVEDYATPELLNWDKVHK